MRRPSLPTHWKQCYYCGKIVPPDKGKTLLSDETEWDVMCYEFYCIPCSRLPVAIRRGPMFDAECIERELRAKEEGTWDDNLSVSENHTRLAIREETTRTANRLTTDADRPADPRAHVRPREDRANQEEE